MPGSLLQLGVHDLIHATERYLAGIRTRIRTIRPAPGKLRGLLPRIDSDVRINSSLEAD
jgi:hypothetical protein